MPAASPITWPEGKRFAFTVFDDTDWATLAGVRPVYSFLRDCGFRTTKSCWVVRGDPGRGRGQGDTCEDDAYLRWLLDLQAQGFEIGWHNATWHGTPREGTVAALDRFAGLFGHPPFTAANHTTADEAIYFADRRLSGLHAALYGLFTYWRNRGRFRGDRPGDPYFWGDLCRQRIKYYRNFVFRDVNTLKACPHMPYYDASRPYVNAWFASSDGHDADTFVRCLDEAGQDRLEAEGGACIMYTHFAAGFVNGHRLEPRFETLMRRLAAKRGWFVPVAELLDHLQGAAGPREITAAERAKLQRRWLREKILVGTN